jgi:hypothetical protein
MAAKNQRKCFIDCGHDNFGEMPRPVGETVELYRIAATASDVYHQATSEVFRKPDKVRTLLLFATHARRCCYQ